MARLLGHRNVFTARAAGHDSDCGATLLQWEGANGIILRLPHRPELAAGQSLEWMIAPTTVRLPALKPEQCRIDNPVTGRVESRLNLGAHFQLAVRRRAAMGDRAGNLARHHGLEIGHEITVDLRSKDLLCWPHLG